MQKKEILREKKIDIFVKNYYKKILLPKNMQENLVQLEIILYLCKLKKGEGSEKAVPLLLYKKNENA